jgi:uncharacterized protein (TIGR01777 family)
MPVFERSTELPCSAAALFRYHAAPGAFARLTPPFDDDVVVEPLRALENGARAVIDVGLLGPLRSRWVAVHDDVVEGKGFVDTMVEGPFKSWRHEHIFEALPDQPDLPGVDGGPRCRLIDRITWQGPAFGLGDFVVEDKLARMCRFRHATTRLDAALLSSAASASSSSSSSERRLRVGVTGATGLIGTEVRALLSVLGHDVVSFVRGGQGAGVAWDTDSGAVSDDASGLDVVVHLAGESIAEGRLDDEKKARLRRGRITQTTLLLDALRRLPRPPRVLVAASAVGVYGDRGDDVVDEDSPPPQGAQENFLSELCRGWEDAVLSRDDPWRTVALRTGIAQSPRGGALQKLAPVFRAGGGAVLGDGAGWTTPIAVDDLAAIVVAAIGDARLRGAVNAVPEAPVTQQTYAKTLAKVLSRPALLRLPRPALRLALGEFGDRLLDSQRVTPSRLLAIGHRWRHADLEGALRHVLGR